MDKIEAKELIKAINNLAKTQQDYNKNLEKLNRNLSDNVETNKEIRTRLLTLATSIDNLTNKRTEV